MKFWADVLAFAVGVALAEIVLVPAYHWWFG